MEYEKLLVKQKEQQKLLSVYPCEITFPLYSTTLHSRASASPPHTKHDQTLITRSSHRGGVPRGTDSIEWPEFELFRSNTWIQRNCILSCPAKWSKVFRPSFSQWGHV